jgi:regulator of nonsense transcripts 1
MSRPPPSLSPRRATFKVTVHIAEAHDGVHPLIGTSTAPTTDASTDASTNPAIDTKSATALSDAVSSHVPDSGIGDSCLTASNTNPDSTTLSDDGGKIVLTNANAVRVNYLLSASEATKNAELEALDHLWGRHINATERQIQAFKYFVLLRNPDFSVNLYEELPHLKGAMEHPTWPGSPLAKKFALLNPQQQAAYFYGFMKLPCGICILPDGPGAGKNHFKSIIPNRPFRLTSRCPRARLVRVSSARSASRTSSPISSPS